MYLLCTVTKHIVYYTVPMFVHCGLFSLSHMDKTDREVKVHVILIYVFTVCN